MRRLQNLPHVCIPQLYFLEPSWLCVLEQDPSTHSNNNNKHEHRIHLHNLQSQRMNEYISCPGCGRTLCDLRETIAQIKEATKHLKGLKIGIMGCIVNGPGEMADADYGYVGADPNKVSLYRKQVCIEKNIPQEVAVEHLLALIDADKKWVHSIINLRTDAPRYFSPCLGRAWRKYRKGTPTTLLHAKDFLLLQEHLLVPLRIVVLGEYPDEVVALIYWKNKQKIWDYSFFVVKFTSWCIFLYL